MKLVGKGGIPALQKRDSTSLIAGISLLIDPDLFRGEGRMP